MFREMRRIKQRIPKEECEEILRRGSAGVLAVCGDGGYPYAVPLSYVYGNGKIYFHCAKSGHKLDAVKRCDKASFCVIDKDEVVPERFLTLYRSVIAFGRIHIIEDDADKRAAIETLAAKYSPEESGESVSGEINKEWSALCMLELDVEHMSGKEGRELAERRGGAL